MKIVNGSTNLFISGLWNIGILTPEWFREQFPEIIKEKVIPLQLSLKMNEFKFEINDMIINPSPQRLLIIAQKETVECYDKISDLSKKIHNKLPHTPIIAIGHNIKYELETENFILFDDTCINNFNEFYDQNIKSSTINSQQIKHSLSYENHILNITYDISKNKKYLSFNYHYDIKNKMKILDFLSEFSDNLAYSEKIYKKLVN